jgi:hypothetical protein
MKSSVFAALPFSAALLTAGLTAQAQHKAHTHGQADASIIYDGSVVVLEMESPADNILGFEHAPKTAAQRSAHTRATKLLAAPGELFSLPGSCSLVEKSVNSPFAGHDYHEEHHEEHHVEHKEDHHDEHHDGHKDHHGEHHDEHKDHHDDHHESHDEEHHSGHSDFTLAYQWQCGSMKSLPISFDLFKVFGNFEKITVQWIGFDKQSSAVVTADNPMLVLE